MIQILTNAPGVAKKLKKMSEEFPKEFLTAFRQMGKHYRKRIQDDMKNGSIPGGVARLNRNTIDLKKGKKNAKGFGGQLRKALISRVRKNPLELELGFLASERAQKFALGMMTARSYNYSPEQRQSLYARAAYLKKDGKQRGKRQSIALVNIARQGHRQPQREFIAPYISAIQEEMPEKISSIVKNLVEKG